MDFLEGGLQILGDTPAGIVRLYLIEVRDVAYVVPSAVLVHVFVVHRLSGDGGDAVEGLDDRHGVGPAAAEVIDLALARRGDEPAYQLNDVVAVDVVAHLLAFVAEHLVGTAFEVALDKIAQEAVQFHAAVLGACEAAAAQRAGGHAKVAAVFLHHHVRRQLRRAKERVLGLVNAEGFLDAVSVGGVGVVPAFLEFPKGDFVGGVAIYLVGAHVDEGRFGTSLAGGLEQVQRAVGVDVEVIEGPAGR